MQTVLNIEGKEVAVGLRWRPLRGTTSEKKETAEIAKEEGSTQGLIFSPASGLSSMVGIFDNKATKGLICGAAWLAQTAGKSTDLILVEPIDDETSWLCAIRNGAPLQGYDLCLKNDEIYDAISGLIQPEGEDGIIQPYVIYSPGAFIANSLDGDLLALTSGDEQGAPPHVQQITGISRNLTIGMVVVFTLALVYGGGTFYLSKRHQAKEEEMAQTTSASEALQEKAKDDKSQAEVQKQLQKILDEKIAARPVYGNQVSAWFDAIADVPSSIAAWSLAEVKCDASNNCDVMYRRKNLVATINDFVAAAQGKNYAVLSAKGSNAVIRIKIDVANRALPTLVIPEPGKFLWDFTSQCQHMELAGLSFNIKDAEHSSVMSEPGHGKSGEKVFSKWAMGEFFISGKRFFEARDSQDYLTFDNISANTFTIKFSPNEWSIGGYYVTN